MSIGNEKKGMTITKRRVQEIERKEEKKVKRKEKDNMTKKMNN